MGLKYDPRNAEICTEIGELARQLMIEGGLGDPKDPDCFIDLDVRLQWFLQACMVWIAARQLDSAYVGMHACELGSKPDKPADSKEPGG